MRSSDIQKEIDRLTAHFTAHRSNTSNPVDFPKAETKTPVTYEQFSDWFDEIENFSSRGDRFYEEFQTMDVQRAVQWLKACWQCARNEHND